MSIEHRIVAASGDPRGGGVFAVCSCGRALPTWDVDGGIAPSVQHIADSEKEEFSDRG